MTGRYPPAILFKTLLRTATGVLFFGAVAMVTPAGSWLGWGAAGIAVLFAGHGTHESLRNMSVFEMTSEGLEVRSPLASRELLWANLTRFALAYYSTRRDRSGGWFQLTLKDRARTVVVESSLEGFESLVSLAVRAAARNGLELNRATIENLDALGLETDTPGPVAEATP